MSNPFKNLNWSDLGKGLLILIVSTAMASLEPIFQSGGWPTWLQFEPILQTTVAAALLYLVKNIFTNPSTLLRSAFGTLNFADVMWGILLAVGSAFLSSLVDILQAGGWPTWVILKPTLISAVAAGLAYIIKNVLTNSNKELLKRK
jgi:hypothetical protein